MSFDFEDIANAIATGFTSPAITPPSGLDALHYVTHQLPENVTDLPCGLVFPPGPFSYEYDPMRRNAQPVWPVRFFFPKWPLPQRMSNLYQWWQLLYNRWPVSSQPDLGLGSLVYQTEIVGNGITTFEYGSIDPITNARTEYSIIEIDVQTTLGEGLS